MKILIPAYEPDERMLCLVRQLKEQTEEQIVIVDDGSGNKYQPIFNEAESMGCTVLHHQTNQGKGEALKTGISYFIDIDEQEGVVCADCDGQHSVADILKVARVTREKANYIVLGARQFVGPVPWRSRVGNTLTRTIFAFATGSRIYDTQTGLRGYPAWMFEWLLKVPGSRFEYELNILLEARQQGYSVYEIPISTIYENNNQSSHFHPVFDSIRVYLPILKFSGSSLAAAGLDFILLLALQKMFNNLLLSVVGARVCSSLFNYMCNRYLVFKAGTESNRHSILRYYSLAAVILGGNYLLMSLLVNTISVPLIAAKIMTEAILFTGSYWVQKKYVFCYPRVKAMH